MWTLGLPSKVGTPSADSGHQVCTTKCRLLSPDLKSRLQIQVRKPSLDLKFDCKLLFCTAEVKSEVQTQSLRLLSPDYKSRLHVHTQSLNSRDFETRLQIWTFISQHGYSKWGLQIPTLDSRVWTPKCRVHTPMSEVSSKCIAKTPSPHSRSGLQTQNSLYRLCTPKYRHWLPSNKGTPEDKKRGAKNLSGYGPILLQCYSTVHIFSTK